MAAAASIEPAVPSTATAAMSKSEVLPRSTWRKKPSQKGKSRFKLLRRPWQKKVRTPPPKPPLTARKAAAVRKAREKKKKATEVGGDGGGGVAGNPVRRRLDMVEEEAGDGGGVDRINPLLVRRRRLDMDAADKIGSGTPRCAGFNRATLKNNLISLAKLALSDAVEKQQPPRTSAASSPEIDLRPYSRAQLMENLRSLAKRNTLLLPLAVVVDTSTADGQQQQQQQDDATNGKKKKKATPTKRAARLVLRPYKSKPQRPAAGADEDEDGIVADDDPIAMALAVRNESAAAGTADVYVPHWEFESVPLPDAKTLRELVLISPAVQAAYNALVLSDETCLGDDDLGDGIPERPELEEERRRLHVLVEKFMGPARGIIGKREFSNWGGSVLTSVVGTFLTQNVTDVSSSNVFMNITAKFSFSKNETNNVGQATNVALITDGCDSRLSEPHDDKDKHVNKLIALLRIGEMDKEHIQKVLLERFETPMVTKNSPTNIKTSPMDTEILQANKDKHINELIALLRTGEISNWDRDKEHIQKVLQERFETPMVTKTSPTDRKPSPTVIKILQDVKSFLENDTSNWKHLLEEAYKNGYRKEETHETIDWEALLHASFGEIEECIKDRGTHSQMTFRILLLLIRIKRDQGCMDLEWLRYIPRAKAKEYLESIIGIGSKSVDCIRLLSLRHRGFPVDVNVARLVTRLGWVPLKPLGDSIEFHMVDKEPVMAKIQEYLEPLLCKIPSHIRYELHCQLITLGKLICAKNRPNCGACPFIGHCKYYKSQFERGRHEVLLKYSQQDERGQACMDERVHDLVMVKPSHVHMYHYQIEMEKSIEQPSIEPIIEIPPTPLYEYLQSSSEEEYEQEYHEEYEQEYHNIVDIEDIVPHYDLEFDIRGIKPTENATTTRLSHGTDMVLIHPHDSLVPIQRRYNLRTEYLAYIIPDGHEILDKFEPRVHGDCNPYLFIIRDYDDHSVDATILIPCRTANKGSFPLDGTYFQINEVFADHSSTLSPIQIKRDIFWNFTTCTVYFGTSLASIARGQTQEGIQHLYHSGYICCRGFDRGSRNSTTLSPALHTTSRAGKKRRLPVIQACESSGSQ